MFQIHFNLQVKEANRRGAHWRGDLPVSKCVLGGNIFGVAAEDKSFCSSSTTFSFLLAFALFDECLE